MRQKKITNEELITLQVLGCYLGVEVKYPGLKRKSFLTAVDIAGIEVQTTYKNKEKHLHGYTNGECMSFVSRSYGRQTHKAHIDFLEIKFADGFWPIKRIVEEQKRAAKTH